MNLILILTTLAVWAAAIVLLIIDVLATRWNATFHPSRRYDVFISHDWSNDTEGRDNHARAR
jgi:hypothetical protein